MIKIKWGFKTPKSSKKCKFKFLHNWLSYEKSVCVITQVIWHSELGKFMKLQNIKNFPVVAEKGRCEGGGGAQREASHSRFTYEHCPV